MLSKLLNLNKPITLEKKLGYILTFQSRILYLIFRRSFFQWFSPMLLCVLHFVFHGSLRGIALNRSNFRVLF